MLATGGFGMAASQPHELTDYDRGPLEEARTLAAERGIDAETQMLRGDTVDELVAYADTIDADLIVVGSRGHGSFASAVLGSVSRGVLREARRPVLVVRGTGSTDRSCGKPVAGGRGCCPSGPCGLGDGAGRSIIRIG